MNLKGFGNGTALVCGLLITGVAGATDYGEKELRGAAVRDGGNNIEVFSDGSPLWAASRPPAAAFDGSLATWYDPHVSSASVDTYRRVPADLAARHHPGEGLVDR